MSVMTEAATVAGAAKARVGTALERLEENARKSRRAVVRVQHAAEDRAAAVALQVRRHPLSTLAVAVAAGALVGGLIGFAVARVACRESS
jgi:ElaB/YqjD/DUF883 family membrane-anchored ribosome-binding protein